MPSLVSWLVAGLAVADRAASLSYTLSKTYNASNFLDEFEFQTSAIDLGPGFLAPSMNYQNKADALDKGLVSVQNGKIYIGVDSKKPSGWGERPTVRVLSKTSFNQGLVITKFTHLPEPVCGGSPFLTRGTGEYPNIGINMYEGWDLYPVKKGTPSAQFIKPGCDTEKTFSNQTLEFSPGFCGIQALWSSDYADGKYGPTCSVITGQESCHGHVANKPQAFENYYFEVENIRIFQEMEKTQSQLILDPNGPSFTFDYATTQPSNDNWIRGSITWDYAKENSGSIRIPPPSSTKAGKYKAYLLSGDRTVLASLPSFDYSPTSDSVAFSVKTHYKTNCAGSVDNNVDIKPGNGVCVNTDCGVGSLEIPSVGSCPDGQVRISYWQNADCAGDWYGYGYGSRGTCRGLWSNGWGFKSLWLSCAEPDSDCIKSGTCTAAPEPSTEVCRAATDAGTTDAFHLKTWYSTGCTGDVHNEVTVPHGNGQCIDTNCAVGSLDIDNVGNCPDGELRISYWEQSGCSGKWFGYGYGSRNTCRTLWSAGSSFKSLWDKFK
ncbi:hypothetical protein NHJ13734_007427 [Beauveria thailandica]